MELPLLTRRSVQSYLKSRPIWAALFFSYYLFLNKEANPISTRQNVNSSDHVTIGVTSFTTGSDQPPNGNSMCRLYHQDKGSATNICKYIQQAPAGSFDPQGFCRSIPLFYYVPIRAPSSASTQIIIVPPIMAQALSSSSDEPEPFPLLGG